MFVFLSHEDVPFDNNHAERTIRSTVDAEKQQRHRNVDGAKTQAILMSFFPTLKQQNVNATQTIAHASQQFATSKKLPTLASPLENSNDSGE